MRIMVVMIILVLSGFGLSGCDSATQPTQPGSVVQSFFEKLNAGDIDGAMVFVDEEARFIGFPEVYIGKEQLRAHFQKEVIERNGNYELSDLQVEGDTARFTVAFTSSVANEELAVEVVVVEGKITSLFAD